MRVSFIVCLGSLLCTPVSLWAAQNPFVETNGRLIIEAESVPASGRWSLETSIPGYIGSGYHVWQGSNHFGSPPANDEDTIDYHFQITQAGNYELRWRSRITTGDEPTEHNDSWIRFPSGNNIVGEQSLNGWTKVYMSQLDTWSWDAYTVDGEANLVRQYFEVGDHVMQIAGRSKGHGIDRVALYQYETIDFSESLFNTLAESPLASASEQAFHEQLSGTCRGNTLSLAPSLEASVSSSGNLDTSQLMVASDAGYSYLKFDLSTVPDGVTSADLVLSQQPPAPGSNIQVYSSNHSNWFASSSLDNMPYPDALIGQGRLSGVVGTLQKIELDASQVEESTQTLIMATDGSSARLNFSTSNSPAGPRLQFSGNGDFCQRYNNSGTPVNNPGHTENEPDTGEQSPESPSSGSGGVEPVIDSESPFMPIDTIDSGNELLTDGETGLPEQTQTTASSGGSLSLWSMMFLSLVLLAGRLTTVYVPNSNLKAVD